jgi:5-methylcytosine-specific restriction enzyme A
MRNPKWSRDEIILTLDFYHTHYPKIPDKTSLEIEKLSKSLRKLQIKLGGEINEQYRNKNGVSMKLMNFHHINPDHAGEGLAGGSKLDEKIFLEFKDDVSKLRKVSKTILEVIETDETFETSDVDDDVEFETQEGQLLTRTHRYRERDRKIVLKKKNKTLKETGSLQCEVCEFDFRERYGDHGDGFIECHHTKPVSEINVGEKTTLDDLSLVCSNCHRMIHRHRPWLKIDELKNLLGLGGSLEN